MIYCQIVCTKIPLNVKLILASWQSAMGFLEGRIGWWARGDLNPGPPGYQPGALTGLSYGPS